MAQDLRGLPRRGLWLLLVHHLFLATACQDADYSTLLQESCLAQFKVDMEAIGKTLWCDWGKTIGLGPAKEAWGLARSWSVWWQSSVWSTKLCSDLLETRSYRELTECTSHVAKKVFCFWPNAVVDKLFVAIHQRYFRNCSVSGRAVRDPPSSVLCPFIVVPILVTLLVTVLVVWRSKCPEGIV
uniref:Receptor activity-modifying protein 1 n=1 Tax=Equus caballus TaxID=9796 RepID=F6YYM9_HORSE